MCTRPREYIKNDGRTILGPCRMCIECRNMRREDFKQRLQFELMDYNYVGSFITLTYRDNELPILYPEGSAIVGRYFGSVPPVYGSTLYRPDIANFCDKMQKRLKRKYHRSGKYIAVGEYGDDLHRPHWHIIYVGLPSGGTRREIYECWNKGNIDVGNINKGAIRYVLDYIDKQVFGSKALYEEYGDFTPPFAHFSKGIGFNWIEKHLDQFDKYGCITYGDSGKTFQLNPYLVEKYHFENKPYKYWPDSVIEYAKVNHIKDYKQALLDRSRLQKIKYEHQMINSRMPLVDTDKLEERADRDKFFMKYGQYPEEVFPDSLNHSLHKTWSNFIENT